MGQGLLELPIFADAVKRCDAVLQPCGIDIYEVLTSEDPAIFDSIINSFVGIITVQVSSPLNRRYWSQFFATEVVSTRIFHRLD